MLKPKKKTMQRIKNGLQLHKNIMHLFQKEKISKLMLNGLTLWMRSTKNKKS